MPAAAVSTLAVEVSGRASAATRTPQGLCQQGTHTNAAGAGEEDNLQNDCSGMWRLPLGSNMETL